MNDNTDGLHRPRFTDFVDDERRPRPSATAGQPEHAPIAESDDANWWAVHRAFGAAFNARAEGAPPPPPDTRTADQIPLSEWAAHRERLGIKNPGEGFVV